MNIGFFSAIRGGVDAYISTLARYVISHGHKVHIIYPNSTIPAWVKDLPGADSHSVNLGALHYYLSRLGFGSTSVPALARQYEVSLAVADKLRIIRDDYGLDLIELTEALAYPHLFGDLPFIYKMHGAGWTFRHYCEDGPYYQSQIRNQRKMMLAASQVHALSRSLADFISGACNVPRRRFTVTPYPIDVNAFRRAQCLPVPEPPYRIMSVGRLEQRKGTHTLVRAMRHVWQHEPNTHLHLFGDDGDFGRERIEEEIPPGEHRGRIHFEGFVRREKLIANYQQSHLYVTPTRYETFGYTILEALACGRPVIASDIGPVPELVRHEENGWLVPRDDVEALAEAILDGLHNHEDRERYGYAAREFAERFSIEKVMPRQMKLYEQALEG